MDNNLEDFKLLHEIEILIFSLGFSAAGAPAAKHAKLCQNGESPNGGGAGSLVRSLEGGGHGGPLAHHPVTAVPHSLLPEEEELINRLVYYQKEFENPSETDLTKVYHVPLQVCYCSQESQFDLVLFLVLS